MIPARAKSFYKKHERWMPIAFFLMGFTFDAMMLRRIDELKVIIQQAIYLVISASLIGLELVESTREVHVPAFLHKIWKYREAVLHFMLGTLLNCYTIFYFKSASALTSFAFIGLLVTLLVLNEFKRFGKSQTQVHMALLSLCLISYAIALAPIILGSIGILSFFIAILGALLCFGAYYRVLEPRLREHPNLVRTHVIFPFGVIATIFALLYLGGMIPPVPLSVTYMGIYHEVKKAGEDYELSYTRSRARFWQHGDQTFLARPGDVVYCFVQVFSPTRFRDQLQVRWLFHDEKLGWQAQDAIPMPIVGGREEGFRGLTKKSNYQPGDWRVQIETLDGREIGWIGFKIVRDDNTEPREMTQVLR